MNRVKSILAMLKRSLPLRGDDGRVYLNLLWCSLEFCLR